MVGSNYCTINFLYEFQVFLKKNGIRHIRLAPYHPSSNGLAECAVQTFKTGIKKMTGTDVNAKLASFLFQYRITPHSTTGTSNEKTVMITSGFTVPISWSESTIKPRSQVRQKLGHDQHTKQRGSKLSDLVFVKNFADGDAWLPGKITEITGPDSYKVTLLNNRVVWRHADHICSRRVETGVKSDDGDWLEDITPTSAVAVADTENVTSTEAGRSSTASQPTGASQTPPLRSSSCSAVARAPPDRYSPSHHWEGENVVKDDTLYLVQLCGYVYVCMLWFMM